MHGGNQVVAWPKTEFHQGESSCRVTPDSADSTADLPGVEASRSLRLVWLPAQLWRFCFAPFFFPAFLEPPEAASRRGVKSCGDVSATSEAVPRPECSADDAVGAAGERNKAMAGDSTNASSSSSSCNNSVKKHEGAIQNNAQKPVTSRVGIRGLSVLKLRPRTALSGLTSRLTETSPNAAANGGEAAEGEKRGVGSSEATRQASGKCMESIAAVLREADRGIVPSSPIGPAEGNRGALDAVKSISPAPSAAAGDDS